VPAQVPIFTLQIVSPEMGFNRSVAYKPQKILQRLMMGVIFYSRILGA
jgi:hypothetical protein